MSLQIQQSEHGSIKILQLIGRLDTETSPNFELAVYDLHEAGWAQYLVDLSQVTYVSSAGLRVLLALAKKVEGKGSMALSGLAGVVREVFEKSGFSRMFTSYPDISTALGAPAPSPSNKPLSSSGSSNDDVARLLGVNPAAARPAQVNSAAGRAQQAAPVGFFAKFLAIFGIGKK
jgi:anti-sigma B factor antagonist